MLFSSLPTPEISVNNLTRQNVLIFHPNFLLIIIVKASERLYSIVQHVSQLTERVRILERDLVKIQQQHIETVGRLLKQETETETQQDDVKEESEEVEK